MRGQLFINMHSLINKIIGKQVLCPALKAILILKHPLLATKQNKFVNEHYDTAGTKSTIT